MLINNANYYVWIFFSSFNVWIKLEICEDKKNNLFTHLIFLYMAFGIVWYAGWNLDVHVLLF